MKINIVEGDITEFDGDAIVNAANVTLLGGGGVDGSIHRAAGPELKTVCGYFASTPPGSGIRCPTGEARITRGYDLPARFVIHAVGPMFTESSTCRMVFHPGETTEQGTYNPMERLEAVIRNCLQIAMERNLAHIAFPAISCGVFGGNINTFAKMFHRIINEREEWSSLTEITFYLFQPWEYAMFKGTWDLLEEMSND